jgi:hypothetical protein
MEKSSQIAWRIVPLRHIFPLEFVPVIEVLLCLVSPLDSHAFSVQASKRERSPVDGAQDEPAPRRRLVRFGRAGTNPTETCGNPGPSDEPPNSTSTDDVQCAGLADDAYDVSQAKDAQVSRLAVEDAYDKLEDRPTEGSGTTFQKNKSDVK